MKESRRSAWAAVCLATCSAASVRSLRRLAFGLSLIVAFTALLYSFQSRAVNRGVAVVKLQNTLSGACLVQLSDGRVLVTGGEGSSGALNSAQLLDSSGTATTVAPMSYSHAGHVCALLDDGRVLVAGGRLNATSTSNLAEI